MQLHLAPGTDDRTPAAQIGYRIKVVAGKPPITLPSGAVLASEGRLYITWADGATDEQESIDFTITLTTVDAAGNVGPESAPIRVRNDGDEGCRASPRRSRLSLEPLLIALAGLAAWRTRPR